MGILDMFKTAPVQAAPVAPTNQQTLPGDIPAGTVPATNVTDVTSANGVVPVQPLEPKAPDSPLAEFSTLWETAPIDPKAPVDPNAPIVLDPKDVQAVVGKANLTSNITPENLAAITAGGEGAQAALMEVMQAVSANTLTQATLISDKLAGEAIERALAKQASQLPDMVRANAASAHLVDTNPLFSDPAIKPVIEATQSQLQSKFPEATPAELTKMTQDYIVAMGATFAPKPADPTAIQTTNWEYFLTS